MVREPDPEHKVTFIKGGQRYDGTTKDSSGRSTLDIVRSEFNEVLSSKNLTFLFGAGCSSLIDRDKRELGIPTMAPMAQNLLKPADSKPPQKRMLTPEIKKVLLEKLGIRVEDEEYAWNLERLMEVLFGFQFVLSRTHNPELSEAKEAVDFAIQAVKKYVFTTCYEGQRQEGSENVLKLYQTFYRKLSQRSRSLPRPTVATTNYDLFNEIAMDRTGVPYINGFLGSIEKQFNPASFRYTLAQRTDLSSSRWTSLDSLVYFLKLHGSLNWYAVDNGIFPVAERPISESTDSEAMLIYPTPAKQNASFAAPYSDIFREFQSRVVREQSALVTVGYGFGDEHVNNIIYQALTIPTFRLVIFTSPPPQKAGSASKSPIECLYELNDPRIWIIGTEDASTSWKAHYFKAFVEDIMPAGDNDPADGAIEQVLNMVANFKKGATSDNQ